MQLLIDRLGKTAKNEDFLKAMHSPS